MYNNVDLFNLERFVKAQDTYDSYNIALKEIKDGWKQSHWMWYVFPQIHGLGHSSTKSLASSPCLKPWRILDMIRQGNAYMRS